MTGLAGEALAATPAFGVPRRRRRSNPVLLALGAVIGLVLLVPLGALLVDAQQAGWHEVSSVLFRARSLTLLGHTVILMAIVTPVAALLGTGAAWFTERTDLPGRRLWTVLLVLPVAMPDFVVGYAWHSIAPTMNPLLAATVVMSLSSYPLVYLPVAAALRRANPALEETARSLNVGALATFLRVTLPQIRSAVLSGGLVVALVLVSEFGAFEIVRFQTFTTEIFTEFQFEPSAAGALSIPLVLLGVLILVGESLVPGSPTAMSSDIRRTTRTRLGRGVGAVVPGLLALVTLSVGIPIGTLFYWIGSSQHSTLPAQTTVGQATLTTVGYCAAGAALAVLLALPIALLSARRTRGFVVVLERSTFVSLALPGVVVALSLAFFAVRAVFGLYETSTLLIVAYGMITFPLALSCLKTSVRQSPEILTIVGRSLGRSAPYVFLRVTLPLIAPGIVAAFCLVFLTATTELTATLILAPIGIQTLTTQFWAFESEAAYGAAAPYALVIIALSMVPGALLALWFGRERQGR
jgi:iron(III) transport system permease protein